MNKRIQKLHDLSELLKSNAITKEEFEILKKELLSDSSGDIKAKTALNDSYRQRVAELKLLRLKSNIDKSPTAGKSNIVKPNIGTQNKSRTSTISKDDNVSSKALLGIGLLFVIGVFIYKMNTHQWTIGTSNESTNTTLPSSSTNTSTIRTDKCNICGRNFTGDGYSEVTDGVWRPCEYPYTSSICSAQCGIKSTQQFNRAANNLFNSGSSSLCLNCGLGHYQNGYCDRCGAASVERVNQSRSKSADCPLCKGTGIEKPMGANSGGETGRICPMCDGTGKQSY